MSLKHRVMMKTHGVIQKTQLAHLNLKYVSNLILHKKEKNWLDHRPIVLTMIGLKDSKKSLVVGKKSIPRPKLTKQLMILLRLRSQIILMNFVSWKLLELTAKYLNKLSHANQRRLKTEKPYQIVNRKINLIF